MNPSDLADRGSRLASIDVSKRQREADLRRTVASSCSARVSALCQTIADLMTGTTRASLDTETWKMTCKAEEDGRVRAICSNPEKMKRVAIGFRRMFFVCSEKTLPS